MRTKWWQHLLWPVAIAVFLFNIVWVNVFKQQPKGK
jgi:hypothetical protein